MNLDETGRIRNMARFYGWLLQRLLCLHLIKRVMTYAYIPERLLKKMSFWRENIKLMIMRCYFCWPFFNHQLVNNILGRTHIWIFDNNVALWWHNDVLSERIGLKLVPCLYPQGHRRVLSWCVHRYMSDLTANLPDHFPNGDTMTYW